MMARIRKSLDENQKGFTLVELLVVVIIIGILAAIAIPVYLNQQNKAKDSAAKSDLANLRTAVVATLTENPTATSVSWTAVSASAPAPRTTTITAGTETETFSVSPGNELAAGSADVTAGTFSLAITSATGKTFTTDASGSITETAPTP